MRLARLSLETYVRTGQRLGSLPDDLPEELTGQAAGAFVSLHAGGRLRGCIGTTVPTAKNVAWEIVQNAVSAGTRDPRFPAVRADELEELEYSVDVLGGRNLWIRPISWIRSGMASSWVMGTGADCCCPIWTEWTQWSSRSTLPAKKAVSGKRTPIPSSDSRWCGIYEYFL